MDADILDALRLVVPRLRALWHERKNSDRSENYSLHVGALLSVSRLLLPLGPLVPLVASISPRSVRSSARFRAWSASGRPAVRADTPTNATFAAVHREGIASSRASVDRSPSPRRGTPWWRPCCGERSARLRPAPGLRDQKPPHAAPCQCAASPESRAPRRCGDSTRRSRPLRTRNA